MSDDLVKRLRLGACALEIEQAADRIEELESKLEALDHAYDSIVQALRFEALRTDDAEAKLAELLAVAKRAVRLSLDHSDFKLYAMEPMHSAIAAAELKGQDDE